jgi:hypothetical protein
MNIFAIALYTVMFLYFQFFILTIILFYLPTWLKTDILNFLSSWFDIKIYYKQKIYNRTIKPKEKKNNPYLPPIHMYEMAHHHSVNLLHYKANIKFASESFAHSVRHYRPEVLNDIFGEDVVICPEYRNLPDVEKFKLDMLIKKIQGDMRRMILENSHLLVKQSSDDRESYHTSYPITENWSFDLFIPSESLPQHVNMGMIR